MNSILDIFNVPFGYLLRFCYNLIPNYAVALLLFTLIIKIVLFPLGIKQQKNMQKQASLRPKEMAIRNRYAGRNDQVTQQKLQQDLMDLYKRENYSPFGGCLPLLIQFPIIIALYNVIRNPLTYLLRIGDRVEAIGERIVELNLAEKAPQIEIDMIQYISSNFGSFTDLLPNGFQLSDLPTFNIFSGFDLSQTPSISNANWLLIVPILTFVSSFLSMKLTKKFSYQPPMDNGQSGNISMKLMDYMMPLMSAWIAFTVPAVIGVYWVYQSIFSFVQQIVLYKLYPYPKFSEEDYKRIEKEMNGTLKKEKKKVKSKSLHNIDEDDDVLQSVSEKTEEPKSTILTREAPVLKEDQPSKTTSKEEKKIRSLHRIDEDDD